MKKIIIWVVGAALLIIIGFGIYFLFFGKNTPSYTGGNNQAGTLPDVSYPSSTTPSDVSGLEDYIGQASDVYDNLPTGDTLQLGTTQGMVQMTNFYAKNPPVIEGGGIVIKQTPNYVITYDPSTSAFWLAITGAPFETWRAAAEQDFLATLGIDKTDACKLSVSSGVLYTPENPLDGKSFSLSFCMSGGAFQGN
jgi:hypothetical protein